VTSAAHPHESSSGGLPRAVQRLIALERFTRHRHDRRPFTTDDRIEKDVRQLLYGEPPRVVERVRHERSVPAGPDA
jgi:hypothetical protein